MTLSRGILLFIYVKCLLAVFISFLAIFFILMTPLFMPSIFLPCSSTSLVFLFLLLREGGFPFGKGVYKIRSSLALLLLLRQGGFLFGEGVYEI